MEYRVVQSLRGAPTNLADVQHNVRQEFGPTARVELTTRVGQLRVVVRAQDRVKKDKCWMLQQLALVMVCLMVALYAVLATDWNEFRGLSYALRDSEACFLPGRGHLLRVAWWLRQWSD